MNIWDYQYEYKHDLKLTDKDGDVFVGRLLDIMDTDEMDTEEPRVTLETSDGIIGFWESEIASIEIVEDKKTPAHAAT